MQRLDKLLSEAGVASRRELKAIIRAGRVQVNGKTVRDPEQKVDETADEIMLDGAVVGKKRMVLLMLHKPAGYVTSTDDPRDQTVMELIPEEYRRLGVVPIGRLDKDTEGFVLITDDGELALVQDETLFQPLLHDGKSRKIGEPRGERYGREIFLGERFPQFCGFFLGFPDRKSLFRRFPGQFQHFRPVFNSQQCFGVSGA